MKITANRPNATPARTNPTRHRALLAGWLAALVVLACSATANAQAQLLFVNSQAAPGGNGRSWEMAYRTVQEALGQASGGTTEIWVAGGTYRVANAASPFNIPSTGTVKLWGGFNGTENQFSQRDPVTNVTILSGDVNGDSSLFTNTSDDATSIIACSGALQTSIIDGFTVQYARGRFALINGGSQITIRNCIFEYITGGAGVDVQGLFVNGTGTKPTITRCTIRYILAGDATGTGTTGNNGSAGTDGGGANPQGGNAGGDGGPGGAGTQGPSGGFATAILVNGSAHANIFSNRIYNITGGAGSTGGTGGRGGRGGDGQPGFPTAGNGNRGGNGGAGGVGGSGGKGGTGGNAVGINYSSNSGTGPSPDISMNLVYNIRGGNGGAPGAGGVGGVAGNGGAGSTGTNNGGNGGNGGPGGDGGIGGLGGTPGTARFIETPLNSTSRSITNNTLACNNFAVPGAAGLGGQGGSGGIAGARGTHPTAPGNEGLNGVSGVPGASGDNGATPRFEAIFVSGTGSAVVSNCVFELPSANGVNAYIGVASGAPTLTIADSLTNINAFEGGVLVSTSVRTEQPNFNDSDGVDNFLGNEDDDFTLRKPCSALDGGSNVTAALDQTDEDGDGNFSEPAVFDLNHNPRFTDVPSVTDTGSGTAPIIDMGAFEADVNPPTVAFFGPGSPSYNASPALFFLQFDRPVSSVPFGLVSVNTTGDVNVNNLTIDRIHDSLYKITAGFTADVGGSLRAVVADFDTITSQVGVPLNGPGSGNVTSDPAEIVGGGGGSTAPTLAQSYISGGTTAPPNSVGLFGFEFSESVTGVGTDDFSLSTTGLSGAFIKNVFTQDNVTWTVEVDTGTQSSPQTAGGIVVRLTDNDSIQSIASGEPLDGPGTGTTHDSPQLTVAGATDCNNNGTPDNLDIQNGTSQDCNDNGVPDECDIADFTVYANTFDSAPGSEWSVNHIETTPNANESFLGQFSNEAATLTLNSLPQHGALRISMDLLIIRSWDGNSAGNGGPDQFKVFVDGVQARHWTFSNYSAETQSYPDQVPASNPFRAGAFAFDTLGFGTTPFGDTVYRIDIEVPHSAATATIAFAALGLQGISDESWGIGSITVSALGGGDSNHNGIPDDCEVGSLDAIYTIDSSWRMYPFLPPNGWNSNLNFDDSDSAGWAVPVVQQTGNPTDFGNRVWSFPGSTGGSNEVYLRKKIRLLAQPDLAFVKVVADDDSQVYVNGVQVVTDTNCSNGDVFIVNIANLLHAGENLIAVNALDCLCCGRVVACAVQLPGSVTDCNNNGVPDRSEIASIVVPDANGNGVPDPCEGTGPDSPRPWPFDMNQTSNAPTFPQGAPTFYPVHTVDLNNDGLLDFVSTGVNGPRLTLRGGPGELMFFNQTVIASGPVFDTVAADFNLDGRVDLVCGTGGGNSLRTFRNTSLDGPTYAEGGAGGTTSAQVVRLAVIDANNDGLPDLLGLQADGHVTLFTNTSDRDGPITMVGAEVANVPTFSNTNNTFDISVADFDHDGKQDFLIVCGGLAVMRGNGNGTFSSRINNSNAYSAAAFVDLSGNGRPLVVAGLFGAGGTIMDPDDFSRSLGTFIASTPTAIRAADIDGDGREDFAVVDSHGTLSWHRQEYLGQLNSRNIIVEGGMFGGLALGDFDPDGDTDLAVVAFEAPLANDADDAGSPRKADLDSHAAADSDERSQLYTSRVRIIPNRKLHNFADFYGTSFIASNGDGPAAAVVADMNGDGVDDLVTASFFDDAISWNTLSYQGVSQWTKTNIVTSAATPRPDGPSSIAVADLDGDGDNDVVAAGILNGVLMWFENQGHGSTFVRHLIDTTAPGASCVAIGDFDRNGQPDIVMGNSNTGQLFLHANFLRGSGTFVRDVVFNSGLTGIRSLAVADFDNTGYPDIAAACTTLNQIKVFRLIHPSAAPGEGPGERGNTGIIFITAATIAQSSPTCVAFADFNNDGNADLACSSSIENDVKVRLGNGDGGFNAPITALAALTGCSWVHAGDLDGDGLIDLAATGRQNQGFQYARNTSNGTQWINQSLFMYPEGPSVCVSGDFDADGKVDLAVGSFNNDRFTTTTNYGAPVYAYMSNNPAAIAEGTDARFADISVTNEAKPNDPSVAYARFSALFNNLGYQANGPTPRPLTASEINALFSRITVYADMNNNGLFDPGTDVSVGSLNGPFTLGQFGEVAFQLSISNPATAVAPGNSRSYFAVASVKPGASGAVPNTFGLLLDVSESTISDTTFGEPAGPRYGGYYGSYTINIAPQFRAACPTDMNASGRTDTPDLVAFLARFGTTTLPFTAGDFDGDGHVSTPDLVKLLSKFGAACN